MTAINDSAQKHVESGGRVKGFAPQSDEARTKIIQDQVKQREAVNRLVQKRREAVPERTEELRVEQCRQLRPAESRRAQAVPERTEAAFEARMAASLARTAPQRANTDAAVVIAPQFTWVGKRVRGISNNKWNFCEGVVQSVTKDDKLITGFQGEQKDTCSRAMQPNTVKLL